MKLFKLRHSRDGGNPVGSGAHNNRNWIPAFAGMTSWGLAGLVLAGCAGVAVAQNAAPATPAPAATPSAAPARAPGMPQPITMARRPNATGGEALYVEKCIMCHGPNGMGTGLLQRAGRPQPLLEARGGLPAQFIITAARNGIGNMPAIPRGEVSDEQMQAIADYLAAGPHEVAQ